MRSKTIWREPTVDMESEDRISEVEDRMVEVNETERGKKRIKRNGTISETSGTMLNAPTFESYEPQKKKKTEKKDHEKILEIIVENFPKLGKEIITQVQETQRVQHRIKPR